MKRFAIVLLVCLNLALAAAVMFHLPAQLAQAQVQPAPADYLTVTTTINNDEDAVVVIDLQTRRMGAWQYDRNSQELIPYAGRDLTRDFAIGR